MLLACIDLQWLMELGAGEVVDLPKMLQVAGDIYEDVTRRKASREQCPLPAPAAKKAKWGLRQRDPW